MFLDLSFGKILVLAVIAIVVFGPAELPKIASQAGRMLRELRRMADGATRELREGLGPEFADFEVTDLHPANFVRKHLFDDAPPSRAADGSADPGQADLAATTTLARDETPPFDPGAT